MRKAVRGIVFKGNDLLVMKRNKFGHEYYTLPGGAVMLGESAEHGLARKMYEESSLQLGDARLVFIEDAGPLYGIQYVYLIDYVGGDPLLSPRSTEASINLMGQNLYQPMWLPIAQLAESSFISERLKQAILGAAKNGFPAQPQTI